MTLTNDAKAVVALTTRLGDRKRPSLTARMWHQIATVLSDTGRSPADLFDRDLQLSEISGVDDEMAERVRVLLTDGASASLEAEELDGKGIWTVTIVDDDYPQSLVDRLDSEAPPVLFGAGSRGLLQTPGIGIVGSRDVGDAGRRTAEEIAREAVRLGYPVISGGARGIDQLAMNSAHSAGGSVVGVLADSLIGRIRRPDILNALDAGTTCLISQQVPSAGFTAGAAMSRNKIVYGLSAATVVVASAEDSGGTWTGATEAIRKGTGTVTVWRGEGEGPGNEALERKGARPMCDVAELSELLRSTPDPAEQLRLDVTG